MKTTDEDERVCRSFHVLNRFHLLAPFVFYLPIAEQIQPFRT